MKVIYKVEDDVLVLDQGGSAKVGGSVGRNSGMTVEYKGPRTGYIPPVKAVATLTVIGFSNQLPLDKDGRYDANTDTRLFGDKFDPDAEYQVVENEDLVSYWRKFPNEEGDWYLLTGVALRRATHHLGKVIARHPKLRNAK